MSKNYPEFFKSVPDFEGRAWLIFEMVSMAVRGGSIAKISLGK